jgi:hypothetical protein
MSDMMFICRPVNAKRAVVKKTTRKPRTAKQKAATKKLVAMNKRRKTKATKKRQVLALPYFG